MRVAGAGARESHTFRHLGGADLLAVHDDALGDVGDGLDGHACRPVHRSSWNCRRVATWTVLPRLTREVMGSRVAAQQIEDRRLARAVDADDTDALGGCQAPGDALKDVRREPSGRVKDTETSSGPSGVLAQARGRHLDQLNGVARGVRRR